MESRAGTANAAFKSGLDVYIESIPADRLLLAMAMMRNGSTLKQAVEAEVKRAFDPCYPEQYIGKLCVWMLDEKGACVRRFGITFEGFVWLPLALDAHIEDHARERLLLTGVKYVEMEDAPPAT